ncbi:Moenomycin biosynthesis protein MoeGT1 [Actinoplanes teichomyceticus]|uniref:Glycosyltransferase n=1 Tax=Actinoplanes teichomyceticus TaxID=1867 RepID=A0A1B1ESL8_ACTTI|nr:Moenomycin biosynthesis protein MoeGT1 [Actinoplanes teichomyceticus]ANQ31708.1 glycosyltransferase [Actinoplanes teichomyceticus]TWG14693.1 UDP-N-acetylglucosamine:LPS N-acetylglucosamine transferase [Actinoplanes teichomyceticus]GIF10096.1 hypothetical protein Ate01nite_01280 [Actinoplanes teichomyceticus]
MSDPRIVVVSPRTWGQFGNFLAATRLAGVLRDRLPGHEVEVWEAEATLPWIGEYGARIAEITAGSPDAATRTGRYLALMAEIERAHPRGFETDPGSAVQPRVAGLRAALEQARPDLVIGTKGFVARLCRAALLGRAPDTPVVSYVTNPGLLELPIHRSADLDAVLVPFDWAKQRLCALAGTDPDTVHVVGPLVARHDLGSFVSAEADSAHRPGWPDQPDGSPRPRIIVFSNRGGDDYVRILRHLAARHPDTDVVFVGYNDPALIARVTGEIDPSRWRFHTRLTQQEYFAYIDGAATAEHAFLISKAGPNTTLEAAHFGIPVLMLRSGLPMEDWVGGLIHEHGLGRCRNTADELLTDLDEWLGDRSRIAAGKRACQTFATTVLDQRAAAGRIENALRQLLDRRSVTASAGEPERSQP